MKKIVNMRFIKFDDLFEDDTKNAIKIKKEDYLLSGKNIVIDQNSNDSCGYTDIDNGIYTKVPTIIFGDHTRVVRYVDTPFFLGADGAKIIKSKNSDNNIKYLYYCLKSKKIENLGYSRHYKLLKECTFLICDKCEQDKIVYVLDTLNKIIELYESQLKNFDRLVKSRFVEMFGTVDNPKFDLEKLGKHNKLQGGYAFKNKDYVDNGVPIVQIGNVNKDYLEWNEVVKVPSNFIEKCKEYELKENDLVMAMTRPIIKSLNTIKIAKVKKEDLPCLLNQRVGRFCLDNNYCTRSFYIYRKHL